MGGLLGDVLIAMEQRPDLEVMALADGAHELWKLFDDTMAAYLSELKPHKLVDLWHLLEKLGAAAKGSPVSVPKGPTSRASP